MILPDMTRYFLTLAYHGARYSGWQIQPNAPSVQETLEQSISTILQQKIEITGCGRTDAGVHARYYVAHFEADNALPSTFLKGLNSILPDDIAIYSVQEVPAHAHARYDAFERSYEYHLSFRKDPFLTETAWFYPQFGQLDPERMNGVAQLLPQFNSFLPFCKTDSGVDSYRCEMKKAHWEVLPDRTGMIFHITANRFLRGMVRLMVGASIQAGKGQLKLMDIRQALEEQTPLPKSLSVPPHGLFLTDVRYPTTIFVPPSA